MQKDFINNLFSLEGKTVLVTGAGRGIGQVVARDMARAGANIAIFSRSGADETVRIIEAEGGKAISIIADCTKEEEVKEGMQKILDAYGSLTLYLIMPASVTTKAFLKRHMKSSGN